MSCRPTPTHLPEQDLRPKLSRSWVMSPHYRNIEKVYPVARASDRRGPSVLLATTAGSRSVLRSSFSRTTANMEDRSPAHELPRKGVAHIHNWEWAFYLPWFPIFMGSQSTLRFYKLLLYYFEDAAWWDCQFFSSCSLVSQDFGRKPHPLLNSPHARYVVRI